MKRFKDVNFVSFPALLRALRRWEMLRYGLIVCLSIATTHYFIENVKAYYFLSDDAFISFRYASNLHSGHGLVWNIGERVEGYTNFLWVILMDLGMELNFRPEVFSNQIGIVSGVVLLLSLVYLSVTCAGWNDPFIVLAPLVLSLSQNFTGWCTGGLATMFFTAVLFLAFLAYLREREKDSTSPLWSSLLFSLAYLTRPDALLFAFIAGLFFLVEVFLKRRKIVSLMLWSTPLVMIVVTHFLWRYSYYGYWLPNTFYAKVNGLWWEQGYQFFSLFNQQYKVFFFLPLMLVPILVGRKFVYALFLCVVSVYSAYVLSIGGDRFEFRFLVYISPYFYWLMSEGIRILAAVRPKPITSRYLLGSAAAALSFTLIVTTYCGARYDKKRPISHNGVVSLKGIRGYANGRIYEGKVLRRLIMKGLLPDDLMVCVYGAGAVPYYTRWPTVDYLGLNDVTIAHQSIRKRRVVAHEKGASQSYLRSRKVELFDNLGRIVHTQQDVNQQCETDHGCRKSIKVLGQYLNFKTFLTDEEFKSRFEKVL